MKDTILKYGKKQLAILLSAVLAGCLLCGCSLQLPERTLAAEPETTEEIETETQPIEEISMVVTADTIRELETYPSLRIADLTGSTCYAEIEDYISRHPEVEVLYNVIIGQQKISPDVSELTLEDGTYAAAELADALPYLHCLKTLNFQGSTPEGETLDLLRVLLPELELRYSVNIAGITCESGAQTLNLSGISSDMIPQIVQKLPLLPNLKQVELLDGAGRCSLNMSDVQTLQAAAPNTVFHYVFELFGRTVSTTEEEVVFANVNLAEQPGAEAALRQALSIMNGVGRVVLDNCGFSNELLAQIREEYRQHTKLVWRVWFAKDGSCLTDREMIRSTFNLTDDNCHDLMYCEDVKYFDMGHNEQLYAVDFVAYMPNLVAVIVSGAPVSDLTPFAGCQKLEFLELAFCGYVRDLSPLAGCYSLERLNVGFTKVSDLSPLDDKNMTILVDTHTAVSNAERNRFEKLHPDCMVQHSGGQPYGHPWRYHPDMQSFLEYYEMLREVFDYENGTNTKF